MSEYEFVNHPAIYPQACVLCGSAKGPLVDTLREGAGGIGRLYVCALCVKRCARVLGLIEGERMEQLLASGDLLDQAKTAIEDRDARIEKMLADESSKTRRIEALEELLQQARDRDRERQHLVDSIGETARQLSAAVNGS